MDQTAEDIFNNELQSNIKSVLKKLDDIKNYTMKISAGSVRGDNYLGVITKVVVTGENKNGKPTILNFIVKNAPQNQGYRQFTPIRELFDREVYMYTKAFPIFTKFQEEKGILKPFKAYAKYYDSTMIEFKEAIVMEDMKQLGFSLCDRREPLDYNHVMLVMREYGKLHALSYALRDQQPELFKELSENTEDTFFINSNFFEYGDALKATTERALQSLDPVKDKIAYNKFKDYLDHMFDAVLEAVKSESAGKYGVICHGDCWMNNILFLYKDPENTKSPTELCLLDWQLSRICSPALDLCYFIFTCTDEKLRDQHYDDMIQEYYKSLSSFLIELGGDPEEMLPFEVLQEHLKKYSVFGLYMAVLVLHLMTSEESEIPDFQNSDDIEKVTENLAFSSKNEEKYHKRIRAVILDFDRFGYKF